MTAEKAYYYCTKNNEPTVELEAIIANSVRYSYLFALTILQHRFPLGEKTILKNPWHASLYAEEILHRRWLKAEPLIRKSKYWDEYKKYFNIK